MNQEEFVVQLGKRALAANHDDQHQKLSSASTPAIVDPESITGYNAKGLPIRESKKLCGFYLRHKFCGYKLQCPFSHPDMIPKSVKDEGQSSVNLKRSSEELEAAKLTARQRKDAAASLKVDDQLSKDVCQALHDWLERKRGGEMLLARIGDFLQDFPQFRECLKSKPKMLLMKHPELLAFRGPKVGHQYVQTIEFARAHPELVDENEEQERARKNAKAARDSNGTPDTEESTPLAVATTNPTTMAKATKARAKPAPATEATTAVDATVDTNTISPAAVKELIKFIKKYYPTGVLSFGNMGHFYKTHPEYMPIFRGRLDELVQQYPTLFALIKNGKTTALEYLKVKERASVAKPPTPPPEGLKIGVSATVASTVAATTTTTTATMRPSPSSSSAKKNVVIEHPDPAYRDGVQALSQFIKAQPNMLLKAIDMSVYFKTFPEHREAMKGRLKDVTIDFPEVFRTFNDGNKLRVIHVGSPYWPKTSGKEASESPLAAVVPRPSPVLDLTTSMKKSPPASPSAADPALITNILAKGRTVVASSPEVVRATLRRWVPIKVLAVDLEAVRGMPTLITLCGGPSNNFIHFPLTARDIGSALIASGIVDLMEDPEVLKVVHTASLVSACFYRVTGVIPKNVFDLRAAGPILFYSYRDVDLTLSTLMELLEVAPPAEFSKLGTMPAWKRQGVPVTKWSCSTCSILLPVYEKMAQKAEYMGYFGSCLDVSKMEVLRGVGIAQIVPAGASLAPESPPSNPSTTIDQIPPTQQPIPAPTAASSSKVFSLGSLTQDPVSKPLVGEGRKANTKQYINCPAFHKKTPGYCPNPNCKYKH